jgi:hypothetical protein
MNMLSPLTDIATLNGRHGAVQEIVADEQRFYDLRKGWSF